MSRVSVTMNKPENDRKTLMARGIVVMLLLSTLVQILSQTLIDNPDDISESMEPTEQTQSMYAQSYDVGNQSRGGYHLVTGDWWEPPLYVPSTSDWDADGFENANDSHPLNPAIPLPGTSPCQSGSPCGEDYAFSAMNPIPNDKKADSMDALVVGDIDGDGDYDAITGGYNKIQLFLNENGVISETATWSGSFSSSNYVDTLALADVDMDGDLDIAGALSNRVKIIENVGGTFATNTLLWTSPSDISVGDIAFGDLDSDGDLDLVIGISSGENEIFSNDGTGDFGTSATWTATNSTDTNTVALADFDIDGDIDMLIGGGTSDYSSSGDGNELFVNNGGFNTTSDWKGTDGHNTKMAEFADLNGDGYLDLFFANFGDPLQIYLYDAGTF
ncbi:MAG: VCBS repeat-containing protein, partial [Candidatus Poseidoniaceae archaeon]|nr:VCBS repeat-containing protein [Candidatus Poseidoniaceae archaeon]